jgi:hypothetical protein
MWCMQDGAPAHSSRALRDVLSKTRHDRGTGTGGPTAWPPRSTPCLNPLEFYLWEHLNPAPVDHEEANCIVDSCLTIRNCRGISVRMRGSVMRRVEARTESQGGHFEHLL